jgi:small GTP-binding protein
MIQKKICMLGAFAVGKTSMVQQFVSSLFSEKYLTTVGVKIDKKILDVTGREVTLMIWDLAGEDQFQKIQSSYLRGASGYLLVVDGTRRNTLEAAFEIQERIEREIGPVPFVLIVNKIDLKADWEIEPEDLEKIKQQGWVVVRTSAKTGEAIEDAFATLAASIVD